MAQLRNSLIIDKLQPKTASYLSITARGGVLVLPGNAMLLLEVAPTALLKKVADFAMKYAHCSPIIYLLEGRVGHLAVSSNSVGELNNLAETIADNFSLETAKKSPAEIVSSELVSRVDSQHAFSINKVKMGSMCVPGETIYTMECQQSSYALAAINAAEKAADIKIIDFR